MTSFSTPLSTKPSRFYFITGKGGVGKTTLSLSLTTLLQDQGSMAEYWCLDEDIDKALLQDLKIPYKIISPMECVKIYAQMRFGRIIGNWIVGTSFFRAILKMLPSIPLLLSLGYMIDTLNNNPQKIIVFDSPSSGHSLIMLSAVKQFRDIFGQGTLFDDLTLIQNYLLNGPDFKVIITAIPTPMALREATELQAELMSLLKCPPEIIINSVISAVPGLINTQLPTYVQRKIELENESLNNFKKNKIIPYVFTTNSRQVVLELVSWIRNIV